MKRKYRNGFTIIEMIVYLALLSVMTVILTRLFTGIVDVQTESEAISAVEQDTRFIYQRLAYDIARASTIVSPSTLGVSEESLTITIGSEAYTYSISGTNLVLANSNGVNVLNSYATGISNLSFRQLGKVDGNNSIQISYSIASEGESISGPDTKTVQTTITLR